jgi:hypothetical protein
MLETIPLTAEDAIRMVPPSMKERQTKAAAAIGLFHDVFASVEMLHLWNVRRKATGYSRPLFVKALSVRSAFVALPASG